MISIIKAEYLKTKRSFGRKILWIAPVITFLMAFVFTLGMTNAYAESVWNWWYTLLLPGMLAIMGYLSIAKEKKIKYYNQVTLATDKRRLMLGKILYMALALLFSNVLVFAGACVGGFLLSTSVPVGGAAETVLVLTVTYLWLIPLSLFLSDKFGMLVNILVCVILAAAGTVIAPSGKWLWFVSSIPMRTACPLLHVLPNGLRAEAGNPLLNTGVILPGIAVSLCWFLVFVWLFLNRFQKKEVK